MDLIHHSQVEKVSKLLERGFDPNYHDSESGGKAQLNTFPNTKAPSQYDHQELYWK